jgi:hypothetical protein
MIDPMISPRTRTIERGAAVATTPLLAHHRRLRALREQHALPTRDRRALVRGY